MNLLDALDVGAAASIVFSIWFFGTVACGALLLVRGAHRDRELRRVATAHGLTGKPCSCEACSYVARDGRFR